MDQSSMRVKECPAVVVSAVRKLVAAQQEFFACCPAAWPDLRNALLDFSAAGVPIAIYDLSSQYGIDTLCAQNPQSILSQPFVVALYPADFDIEASNMLKPFLHTFWNAMLDQPHTKSLILY